MTDEPSGLDQAPALPANAGPNRFESRSLLGEGGMGTVHLAFDRLMLREVALKTIRRDLGDFGARERRFIREAQLAGRLDHPNIVPVYDLAAIGEGTSPTLVMKYVDGEAYSVLIERLHASPTDAQLRDALEVFVKVCDAISFAHERGVIHCDLKPENVMVGRHGQVYVMDWGGALFKKPVKPERSGAPREKEATRSLEDGSQLFGSLGYMAPEQLQGDRSAIDITTDVYGLGGILCVLITGRPPRTAVGDIAQWHISQSVEERTGPFRVPPELCRIADRALNPAQADRFQTVGDLKAEVDAFMAGGGWFETRNYLAGDRIVREGETRTEAFIISSGVCEVFKNRADGRQQLIRTMGPGETFGELSILTGKPRSATVVAQTNVTLRLVTRDALDRELQRNPVLASFMSAVTSRFCDLESRIEAAQE